MKIICIGRNYADHIDELDNVRPDEPVIFIKPDTAIAQSNLPFFIPEFSNEVHHEVEVLVRINRIGKHIQTKFAHKYYDQIGLGIDFTARDVQQQLKSKGFLGKKQRLLMDRHLWVNGLISLLWVIWINFPFPFTKMMW
jgi:2-keto-4-pentenoate hydratase/2-oxohepta-3-ene-1,7-dioic acid hydratase in catechol pathway